MIEKGELMYNNREKYKISIIYCVILYNFFTLHIFFQLILNKIYFNRILIWDLVVRWNKLKISKK